MRSGISIAKIKDKARMKKMKMELPFTCVYVIITINRQREGYEQMKVSVTGGAGYVGSRGGSSTSSKKLFDLLRKKALWIRKKTLQIHGRAPETRLASSLSAVEILVVLYYGRILNLKPNDMTWKGRDRFIISKGHGAVSLYPILADLGFLDRRALRTVGEEGSALGAIPGCAIPGMEMAIGSLGHGLGIGIGMAKGLRLKNCREHVFVLLGDGELYEGSIWEAIMFAGEHGLSNLIAIIDNNKVCMLDYCKNIIDLAPLEEKLLAFGWHAERVDGHKPEELYRVLSALKKDENGKPKILIADTVKGKGVFALEADPLCHVRSLSEKEIRSVIAAL